MRKSIYFLFVLLPMLTSCREEGLKGFEDSEASVYFYLDEKKEVSGMVYSFVYTYDEKTVIKIPVKCSGIAAGYDRHFRVEVVADSTTAIRGKHYDLEEEGNFPANCYDANFPVVLYSQDTALLSNTFVLTIRLIESSDFRIGGKERLTTRIQFSNRLVKPDSWQDWMFGEWSRVKHKRLLSIAERDFPSVEELNTDMNFWYYGVGQELKNYFIKNYPVTDENNKVIEPW